jgi:hypothetical protein
MILRNPPLKGGVSFPEWGDQYRRNTNDDAIALTISTAAPRSPVSHSSRGAPCGIGIRLAKSKSTIKTN